MVTCPWLFFLELFVASLGALEQGDTIISLFGQGLEILIPGKVS